MSERKAINKYYPPDWDPSKVPKKKKNTNPNAEKVRLMAPFSMKCLQCQEYISARRKFNARKEITDEKYMGIKIVRFHIKCPRCNNSLLFQTDPKSAGFIPVAGCAKNYESAAAEPVKPMETEDEIFERLEKQEKENQEFQEQQQRRKNNPFWLKQTQDSSKDAMSNLEDKLIEQKREQEIHDHLMYLQAKSSKLQQSGGPDQLVEEAQDRLRLDLKRDREEEELVAAHLVSRVNGKQNVDEIKAPPTVSGRFTVKKPKPLTDKARHLVTSGVSPGTDTTGENSLLSKAETKVHTVQSSVFGAYESSEDEEDDDDEES